MSIEIQRNVASTVYIFTPQTSWALFTFSNTGDIFLQSDWGSYTHRFRAFSGDIETFLKGLSVEYFVNKLSMQDVNQKPTTYQQKEILTILVERFIYALNNENISKT